MGVRLGPTQEGGGPGEPKIGGKNITQKKDPKKEPPNAPHAVLLDLVGADDHVEMVRCEELVDGLWRGRISGGGSNRNF